MAEPARCEDYFPTPLRERFAAEMPEHRLRREIVATAVVNRMVNRAGITFAHRMAEELAAPAPDVLRAHAVASEVFAMPGLWAEVEALDNVVPTDVQTQLLLRGRQLVERATRWLLTNRRPPLHMADTVAAFAPGVALVVERLPQLLGVAQRSAFDATASELVAAGVPSALAHRVAGFTAAFGALDVVAVAGSGGWPVEEVAPVYYALDGVLELGRLRERVMALPRADRWQTLARAALRDDLNATQAALTAEVLEDTGAGEADKRIAAWTEQNAAAVARATALLEDVVAAEVYDVTTLSVALRQVRSLVLQHR